MLIPDLCYMPGGMFHALMDIAPPSCFLVGDSVQVCHSCLFKIILLISMRPPLLKMLFILLLLRFTTYIRRFFLHYPPAKLYFYKIPSRYYGILLESSFLFGRTTCLISSVMLIDNLSVPDASCDHTRHLKIDPIRLLLLHLPFYLVAQLVFSLVLVLLLRTPLVLLCLRLLQPQLLLHQHVSVPLQHGPGSNRSRPQRRDGPCPYRTIWPPTFSLRLLLS